jgi:hypothetical protein
MQARFGVSKIGVSFLGIVVIIAIVGSGLYFLSQMSISTITSTTISSDSTLSSSTSFSSNFTINTTEETHSTNTIRDNYTSESFLIWSNNTSIQDPISNISVITNETVSCQVIQFNVSPMSFVFIHPPYVVNNNGTFFGLAYANGTSIPYLANANQDFYYTNGAIAGTVDMTFTLPGHGGCN